MQQLVAGLVAEPVVDLLELVHVDKRGHQALPGAARAVHVARQLLQPHPAAARAGQLVGSRLLAVARRLLAVPGGLLAVARGELPVASGPPAVVLRALAGLDGTAPQLLHSQGVLVIDGVAPIELQRRDVGDFGSLVA